MDWVETTGKSVEEALERALAHLGVHRDDAEIEVIEEPRAGLFGRVRGEARVRARVRPSGPRPKRSGQSRRGGRGRGGRGSSGPEGSGETKGKEPRPKSSGADKGSKSEKGSKAKGGKEQPSKEKDAGAKEKSAKVKKGAQGAEKRTAKAEPKEKEETMADGLSLAEQGRIAQEFVVGLLGAMEIQAQVSVVELDEETVEIAVNAEPPTELGVLVGPRGSTLAALQEITRTAVQARNPGRTDRILVDVAKYRERRVAALGRFAQQVASEVVETGEERALEPMSAADRKAIHDALTDVDGVQTRSEGEEPRRFVVVSPA